MSRLLRHPEPLAVVRLGPGSDLPPWAESSSVFSITATADETTIVCGERGVPTKTRHRRPLVGFRVQPEPDGGAPPPLPAVVAVLAPLVDDGIEATPVPTFDTLWLLVPADDADRAEEAWRRSGHDVDRLDPSDRPAPPDA